MSAEDQAARRERRDPIFREVVRVMPELTAGQTSTVVDLIEGASK